ncbi:MAG: Rieske 2Fe-2S domain-containing protein [Gemmataceae bacterium]
MSVLDHWHPLLLSCDLGRKPVAVRLDGYDIALFRTPEGVAALDDVCPHRRMRLSLGDVVDGRLQCRYHGWTFTRCGAGESPGTPKLTACATSYEVREEQGAVWVRGAGSSSAFPQFDVAGYHPTCTLHHRIKAPLELVMDNFCEIEHTPTTHGFFGYDLDRMHEVKVRFEPTDTTVRVVNVGPAKGVMWPLRKLLGIRKTDHFYDDWTTHFSPPHSIYEHVWIDPASGAESMVKWKFFIFFSPLSATETALTSFVFVKSRWPGPAGGVRLFKWLMRWQADVEIKKDIFMLENLADQDTGIEGLKLSRFDRVLGLNRERLRRVYRGEPAERRALTMRKSA